VEGFTHHQSKIHLYGDTKMEQDTRKIQETQGYYTLGGVVTKDTLTIDEQKELRMKNENETLTDDERKKLLYDDSRLSVRSTTGILKEDRVTYNPNVEYFMLDYHLKDECRWVRMGYMTQYELLYHLQGMVENYYDYSGIRIHSEKELDVKYKVECEDGEYRELTLRHILFDGRYEHFSDLNKNKSGDPEWKDFMKGGYEDRNRWREDTDVDEKSELCVLDTLDSLSLQKRFSRISNQSN
jgi:hypothetical protein